MTFVVVWLVLVGIGAALVGIGWYWAHTWPLWAWSSESWPFVRFVWRRLTRR